MTDRLLEAEGLYKSYRKGGATITVLHDAHLAVRAGEMVSIIGASGAGKSTLLHLLGTLDAPDRGDIRYRGESLVGMLDAKADRGTRTLRLKSLHLDPAPFREEFEEELGRFARFNGCRSWE